MGWTEHVCKNALLDNGKINIKAELDSLYNYSSYDFEKGTRFVCEVLKSAIRGNEYYAAVKYEKYKNLTKLVESKVIGVAGKYSLRTESRCCDFAEKINAETVGPKEDHCPLSILKLLPETDSDFANDWRRRCYRNIELERNKDTLGTLPIGSIIEFKVKSENGGQYLTRFIKSPPNFQFKRSFWYNPETNKYIKARYIPKDFVVIRKGYI